LLDDFAADLVDTEEIKDYFHALCRHGAYTVVELTGAKAGLIYTGRTFVLDQGKIQEEQK
jgi:hypothetical protein